MSRGFGRATVPLKRPSSPACRASSARALSRLRRSSVDSRAPGEHSGAVQTVTRLDTCSQRLCTILMQLSQGCDNSEGVAAYISRCHLPPGLLRASLDSTPSFHTQACFTRINCVREAFVRGIVPGLTRARTPSTHTHPLTNPQSPDPGHTGDSNPPGAVRCGQPAEPENHCIIEQCLAIDNAPRLIALHAPPDLSGLKR